MGKFTKKAYFKKRRLSLRNANYVQPNMVGFLCTFIEFQKEREAIHEAYNIFGKFANLLYGEEIKETKSEENLNINKIENVSTENQTLDTSDVSDSEDIGSELKNEIEKLKSSNTKQCQQKCLQRFVNKRIKVKHSLFIQTKLQDPVPIAIAIMDDILENKRPLTTTINRVHPVHATCKTNNKSIQEALTQMVFDRFPKTKLTYFLVYNVKNNDKFKDQKECITAQVNNIIKDYNLDAVSQIKDPDLVIKIDICGAVCYLALLPHYTKYCKYNLRNLLKENKDDTLE